MPDGGTRTVLFSDLVGSTALLTELGPERFEELLAEHDRFIAAAVAANDGELVKHTGDGAMAVFSAAVDGLDAAVEIQQAMERRNRRSQPRLEVRVGLSAGDVSAKEGDYFGPAPVEARRLCDAASGGQILVADVVRVLAGTRGDHEFELLGALELKGLPALATVVVRWNPLEDDGRVPFPDLLEYSDAVELVGREAELETLLGGWERTRSGGCALVVISGEAGIGKTRLTSELGRHVHGEGGTVLLGRCDQQLAAPFAPIIEVLDQLVAGTPDPELRLWIGDAGAELSRLVPTLRARLGITEPIPEFDATSDRSRLFEAISGLLRAAALTSPILVVLDDVQWADPTTLLLVRHLLLRARLTALLVCATVRDHEPAPAFDAAWADLSAKFPVETVRLRGLSEAAVEQYLACSEAIDLQVERSTVAASLCERTGGNPFFLGEVVRDLGDFSSDGVPARVKDVLRRRLDGLSPETQRILAASAVIGLEFRVCLLEALGSAEPVLLDALDEAVAAGIVRDNPGTPDRFEFRHALVRDEVYGSLTALRRCRLHRAVADVLITESGGPEHAADIAHHLLAAGTSDDRQAAVEFLRSAADHATSICAYERAAELLDRAAGIAADEGLGPAVEAELRIALGDALAAVGEVERCDEELLQAGTLAEEAGRTDLLVAAALGAGSVGYFILRTDPAMHALLELAEERTRGERSPLRVRLVARLALERFFSGQSPERWAALVNEALSVAAELADPGAMLHALRAKRSLETLGPPMGLLERNRTLELELQLAEQLGDPVEILGVRYDRIHRSFEAGALPAVEAEIERCEELSAPLRHPFYRAELRRLRNVLALLTGRFDDVEAPDPDQAHGFGSYTTAIQEMTLAWMQGHDLEAFAAGAGELAEQFPGVAAWRAGAAFLTAESGQLDSAHERLLEISGRGLSDLPREDTWLMAVCLLAIVSRRTREAEVATHIAALLDPYRDWTAFAFPSVCLGSVRLYLAVARAAARDYERAIRDFEAAEEANTQLGARPFLAFGRVEHAHALIERAAPGDTARAGSLLEAAEREATALGMKAVAAHASTIASER
jgi:class 3 adenylate cyclase/tetratricopeptide (TPR) repeat protein